jgi:hypothetical protein
MSQTTVLADVLAGRHGAVASEYGPTAFLGAKVAKVAIAFGLFVHYKVSDGSPFCNLPAVTGDVTAGRGLGFAIFDPAREPNAALGYAAGDTVSIIRKGHIWLAVEDSAVEGASVFVRFDGTGTAGAIRSDADTSHAVALPGAVFRSTQATAGGLVLVELNMP